MDSTEFLGRKLQGSTSPSATASDLYDSFSRLQLDTHSSVQALLNGQQPASDSAPRSLNSGSQTSAVSSTSWLAGPQGREEQARTPLEQLDQEVLSFVSWCRPSVGEHDFRLNAYRCFERVVHKLWPGAQVELFGSMVTGLYLPHGDFDVVVHHAALERLRVSPTSMILQALRNAVLSSTFASPASLELVTSAKVPICKFTATPRFGSYRFDVSFNGPKGPAGARESTRLLTELKKRGEERKDRAKRLVVLWKALLDGWGLNEVKHGGLGGLSTFCMAVSYVQLDSTPGPPPSPGRDLVNFIDYYAYYFNYNDAISTANGGSLLDKSVMRWVNSRDPARLSIQHPVDPRIHFSPKILDQRKRNQQLALEKTLDELVTSWEPDVREEVALQRMRANGHVPPPPPQMTSKQAQGVYTLPPTFSPPPFSSPSDPSAGWNPRSPYMYMTHQHATSPYSPPPPPLINGHSAFLPPSQCLSPFQSIPQSPLPLLGNGTSPRSPASPAPTLLAATSTSVSSPSPAPRIDSAWPVASRGGAYPHGAAVQVPRPSPAFISPPVE
ncbi:hypothetical protein JCM11641_003553 [Rhodosporidiobolus odoratus]